MGDYLKYRGKCKEMSEALVKENTAFRLVRGHYICPYWGEQPHWWTVDQCGNIVDPTVKQFPSKGLGEYIEFNGIVNCSNCGEEMNEKDARFDRNYAFCSYTCNMRFVGL